MATFLVRYLEAGRDAQRGGQRRDLAAAIVARVPAARVEAEPGRLVVEGPEAVRAVLDELSGITSFSPCTRCAVGEVGAAVVARAAAIPRGGTFRVRAASRELAARLGGEVLAARPDVRVDLHAPDVVLGVEVRGAHAFVFDAIVPGRDWRGERPARPEGEPRFIADQMLGRVATWLRLLGYDTVHPWDQPDSWVLRLAREEGRIVLTRDGALARVQSAPVYLVRADRPVAQLEEIVRTFDLEVADERMFTRCPRCNVPVEDVAREAIVDRLPAAVAAVDQPFRRCPSCDRIYWRGGHVERILGHLRTLNP